MIRRVSRSLISQFQIGHVLPCDREKDLIDKQKHRNRYLSGAWPVQDALRQAAAQRVASDALPGIESDRNGLGLVSDRLERLAAPMYEAVIKTGRLAGQALYAANTPNERSGSAGESKVFADYLGLASRC